MYLTKIRYTNRLALFLVDLRNIVTGIARKVASGSNPIIPYRNRVRNETRSRTMGTLGARARSFLSEGFFPSQMNAVLPYHLL